jgi:hypothetical protein
MNNLPILKESNIANYIYFIRGEKVMLDLDLARLYEIETRILKQSVRRNIVRFPKDFMFELTEEDLNGILVREIKITDRVTPFSVTGLKSGLFLYRLISDDKEIDAGKILIQPFYTH